MTLPKLIDTRATTAQASTIAMAQEAMAALTDIQFHALCMDRADKMPPDAATRLGDSISRVAHLRARPDIPNSFYAVEGRIDA